MIRLKEIPKGGLPKKLRTSILRQNMPEEIPEIRSSIFSEVNLGYTTELAMLEANRCIECKDPVCVPGCPVNVDIPVFVRQVAEGEFMEAAKTISKDNVLPAVCGRICPQEKQCELTCILGIKWKPLAIGHLERFVADYARMHNGFSSAPKSKSSGKKVAIIGGGPAGLACSKDLVIKGHDVTIFEALHKAGGVLTYGIPSFRLPPAIVDSEIESVVSLGVKIETNVCVGRTTDIDDLFDVDDFDAIFVATGAGSPRFPGLVGENLNGIYSANEFLTRVNLMKGNEFPRYDSPVYFGKNVVVIGGGNTALDAVRVAKRLGANNVTIVYRRGYAEMPARKEEIRHAKEEGIDIIILTAPIEFIGKKKGWVTHIKYIRMKLGELDPSGRRSMQEIPGSEIMLEADTVIIAIGTNANPIIADSTNGLRTNERGYIEIGENSCETSRKGVFAGGDIVTGAATVILAMAAGRRAAKSINIFLLSKVHKKITSF